MGGVTYRSVGDSKAAMPPESLSSACMMTSPSCIDRVPLPLQFTFHALYQPVPHKATYVTAQLCIAGRKAQEEVAQISGDKRMTLPIPSSAYEFSQLIC